MPYDDLSTVLLEQYRLLYSRNFDIQIDLPGNELYIAVSIDMISYHTQYITSFDIPIRYEEDVIAAANYYNRYTGNVLVEFCAVADLTLIIQGIRRSLNDKIRDYLVIEDAAGISFYGAHLITISINDGVLLIDSDIAVTDELGDGFYKDECELCSTDLRIITNKIAGLL